MKYPSVYSTARPEPPAPVDPMLMRQIINHPDVHPQVKEQAAAALDEHYRMMVGIKGY